MQLTHLDNNGQAIMVDVSNKKETQRIAIASGIITMSKEAFFTIKDNTSKKGDVLSTARIAGIMGSKQTSSLIPLCHPISITKAKVNFEFDAVNYSIKSTVETVCTGKTGVEMEALCACSISLLTIYDMVKAIDRSMIIKDIKLEEKNGGKSGHYKRA